MSSRVCPRCEYVLPAEADGSLLFCPACGAPQVRVSEQLLDEVAQRRHSEQQDAALLVAQSRDTTGRDLLRTAGLVGLIAAALALLSGVLPFMTLLLWFWAVGAPVAALGLHRSRQGDTRSDPGFGARLGFLSGIAVAFALMAVNTGWLLLARFAFHRSRPLDTALAGVFTQMSSAAEAQYGASGAAPLLGMLRVPEVRAGLLLASTALFLAVYVLLATAGGAFAGFLRGRSAQT